MLCEDAILEAFDAGLEEDELLPAFKRLEAWVQLMVPMVSGVLSHSPIMSHTATRGVARLERQRSAMNKMMLPDAARNSAASP